MPLLFESFWHSDGIPERIFQKSWFWKKSTEDKKSMKNYPGGKELTWLGSYNPTFVILNLLTYGIDDQ